MSIPITSITCSAIIHESLAHIDIEQKFVNPTESSPLELTYLFPKMKDTIISKLFITIGEKVIEARIMEKQKAEEKYSDAVAAGHSAVKMAESKKEEFYEIMIGNLQPGKEVAVRVQMQRELYVENGLFVFGLPWSMFPDQSCQVREV